MSQPATNEPKVVKPPGPFRPFQRATLRGLAIITPPLLTIVLFIWAWNTIDRYVLQPVEQLSRDVIVWNIQDSLDDSQVRDLVAAGSASSPTVTADGIRILQANGKEYVAIKKTWIPRNVFEFVEQHPAHVPTNTAADYYDQYVQFRFLRRHLVIPAFLAIFIAVLYLVGKLFAAGIGRLLWNVFESLINQIPFVRSVYSSVKQITDFAFNETQFRFTRVVAIEYPRKGIWSMGFVTGDGMRDIQNAAGEPVVNVLTPTSPMPATGFTIVIPKSQTVELNITIDQAIQFCVSCGVVIPSHQYPMTSKHASEMIKQSIAAPPQSP